MIDAAEIERLHDWMCAGAMPPKGMAENVDALLRGLNAAGLPVSRFALFVLTIHPQVKGKRVTWTPADGVEIQNAPHDFFRGAYFLASPAHTVLTEKTPIRCCFARGDAPGYEDLAELRDKGATDYYAQPLVYTDGRCDAATWTTHAPGGFADDAIAALDRVNPGIARLIEIWILKINTITLLSTYVGRDAGAQVLNGQIRPGDAEEIPSIILFADLKSFTEMSNARPVSAVLEALNDYFREMEAAIQGHGGEILKFIGDGVLAIFPTGDRPDEAAARALAALDDARAALGERAPFRAALHAGVAAYGNVGGLTRLDFTAIGPDVNLTARLLAQAGAVGADMVCSSAFAVHAPGRAAQAGAVTLKGFSAAQPIYRL